MTYAARRETIGMRRCAEEKVNRRGAQALKELMGVTTWLVTGAITSAMLGGVVAMLVVIWGWMFG